MFVENIHAVNMHVVKLLYKRFFVLGVTPPQALRKRWSAYMTEMHQGNTYIGRGCGMVKVKALERIETHRVRYSIPIGRHMLVTVCWEEVAIQQKGRASTLNMQLA